MLIVEVASLLVGAVGLVLQEVHRRRESTPGTRKALIELHILLNDWANVAESVNEVLEAEVSAGVNPAEAFDPFDGLQQQGASWQAVERQMESDKLRHDPESAITTLATYAPEAVEALRAAASIRADLVTTIVSDYAGLARRGELPLEELRDSATALRAASNEVRNFIVANFPPA